jgi:tripartite-type tricarboxylate transporter receptor subunit TctC
MATVLPHLLLIIVGLAWSPIATAQQPQQTYPNRVIRWIVPYTPGGPTDIHSRAVAQKLSEAWGQPVVVENRAGAAGMIGTEIAARTAPDGYTLCTATIPFTTALTLDPKMSFNPATELSPVALMGAVPNILVVHPSLPATSVKELVALAKTRPGQLLYPTGGVGGAQWLAGAYFEHLSKTKVLPVQYRGGIPGITALLSGEVSVGFSDLMTTLPHVQVGKLRLLAVTSAKRSAVVPDVPSVAETLPGFDVTAWFGIVVRAGTPKPIVEKLNREVLRGLQAPDTRKRLAELGSERGTLSPEEFGEFLKAENQKWARVIKAADARKD